MPNNLDINTLETWLWEAACKIRGEIDALKYKDYILPLIFLKRLSDVFDDEMKAMQDEYGNMKVAEDIAHQDHSVLRFYLPVESRWNSIAKKTAGIGEHLTNAVRLIAKENPKLQGVIDIVDFNATAAGQRIISDERLKTLIDVLGKYRLGLQDVAPDIIGMAYEYLLRKFAEGSGQSAGEFYTPREVAVLMSFILDPEAGESFYDPTVGSGGLLIKSYLRFKDKYRTKPTVAPLRFFGQEISHITYAMARMNAFLHDMELVINKNKRKKAENNPPSPPFSKGGMGGFEGEVRLINASRLFAKGRPKNYLTDENIQKVFKVYAEWKDEDGISKIIKNEEAIKNDYNLSPSRYVSRNDGEEVLPIEEAIVQLKEAEEERVEADKKLKGILGKMGLV